MACPRGSTDKPVHSFPLRAALMRLLPYPPAKPVRSALLSASHDFFCPASSGVTAGA